MWGNRRTTGSIRKGNYPVIGYKIEDFPDCHLVIIRWLLLSIMVDSIVGNRHFQKLLGGSSGILLFICLQTFLLKCYQHWPDTKYLAIFNSSRKVIWLEGLGGTFKYSVKTDPSYSIWSSTKFIVTKFFVQIKPRTTNNCWWQRWFWEWTFYWSLWSWSSYQQHIHYMDCQLEITFLGPLTMNGCN